jgi:type VI secretion system protein VasD
MLVLGALVAGCAAPPPPKPVVTQVSLTLTAAADANPDARGRASPLAVRVYVLKTPGVFQSADFFTLYDKDVATLGADLVQREEVQLLPGENKKLAFTLQPDAKLIGVIAAYRDLEHATWREMRPLDVGKPNNLEVKLGTRQISIVAQQTADSSAGAWRLPPPAGLQ